MIRQLTYIDQDVHSPEQLDSLRDRPLTRLSVRDIGLNGIGNPAFSIDHPLRLLHPLEVVVEECNLGTVSSQKDCCRAAVSNFALRRAQYLILTRLLAGSNLWSYAGLDSVALTWHS